MDTQDEKTGFTVKQAARKLGNGDLAQRLKGLREATAAHPMLMTLSDDPPATVTLTDEQMAYVDEAATRLEMMGIMSVMEDGKNLQYTDAQIKALPDEKIAEMLKSQIMNILMDSGDPENPINLSPQGETCLERRLARECADRLKRYTAREYGQSELRKFVEENNHKIKPYRPGE